MLRIRKASPPPCITELKKTPGADWSTVTGAQKAEMRQHLLREQAGLCAYCMRRIHQGSTTVEHWAPRSEADADPFEWEHLLGVCDGGGPGAKPSHQHCDRSRGAKSLALHPAHPTRDVEQVVRYKADGRVWADDPAHERELESVLQLNVPNLRNGRRQVVDAVVAAAQHATATQLRTMIDSYTTPKNGLRAEYAGAALYFLTRRLTQTQAIGKQKRTKRP
ncbi:MAG: TIGR02646 family protein [Myxococcales bacterium]|nr:TIGR02646 family protein [Myxococcales bacterium]